MGKLKSVYFIKAAGCIYVGVTNDVPERWAHHQKRIAEAKANPLEKTDRKYRWFARFEPHEVLWSVFVRGLTPAAACFLETALIREFRKVKQVKVLNVIADVRTSRRRRRQRHVI